MRKVLVVLSIILSMHVACRAIDNNENFLSLVKMAPENITQTKVVAMFGKPERVEESRKGVKWYYAKGNTELTINWYAHSGTMQKFSFSHTDAPLSTFDNSL